MCPRTIAEVKITDDPMLFEEVEFDVGERHRSLNLASRLRILNAVSRFRILEVVSFNRTNSLHGAEFEDKLGDVS
jgi:hypothetical protein